MREWELTVDIICGQRFLLDSPPQFFYQKEQVSNSSVVQILTWFDFSILSVKLHKTALEVLLEGTVGSS